jgi:hypothetical protein
MKTVIGTITGSISSTFPVAVSTPDGKFNVAEPRGLEYGQAVIARYDPQDQFATIIPLEVVERALAEFYHVGADDYLKHPYPRYPFPGVSV